MNLFNIEQEFLEICNELEENGGELTPELESRLIINGDNVDSLIHKYHSFIQFNKANTQYLKDRRDQLVNRIKSTEKAAEFIKNKALDALIAFGNTSKTGSLQLKYEDLTVFSRTTESVEIDEEAIKDTVIALDPDLETFGLDGSPFELEDELNTIAKTSITLTLSPYHAKQLMLYINTGIVDLKLESILDDSEEPLIDKKYDIIWDKAAIKQIGTIETKGISIVKNTNINFR